MQVGEEAIKLSPEPELPHRAHLRRPALPPAADALQNAACTIAVGTPGRVLDHLSRGTLSLDHVRYVVLDEADRMLDIGFRPDIEKILRRCPTQRQTLLLSATLPPPVLRLAQRYMVDPFNINLSPAKLTVENIHQSYFTVDEDRKFELLLRRLRPRGAAAVHHFLRAQALGRRPLSHAAPGTASAWR